MDLKSKTKAGGRCCICFDPFSIQNVSVVIFFCCHAYHLTCYTDSLSTFSDEKETRDGSLDSEYDEYDEEENGENESDSSRMRCILCTNAARWPTLDEVVCCILCIIYSLFVHSISFWAREVTLLVEQLPAGARFLVTGNLWMYIVYQWLLMVSFIGINLFDHCHWICIFWTNFYRVNR